MQDFIYDSEQHIGVYRGGYIPSVTQILEKKYPLPYIPLQTLQEASERGTLVHEDIENYNYHLIDEPETEDGKNFVRIITELGLKVVDCEKQILIKDKSGKVVCYGTYDGIFLTTKPLYLATRKRNKVYITTEKTDTLFCEAHKFVLFDNKTICKVNKEKVADQLSIYEIGINDYEISAYICMWLRSKDKKAEAIPLPYKSKNYALLEELLNGNDID